MQSLHNVSHIGGFSFGRYTAAVRRLSTGEKTPILSREQVAAMTEELKKTIRIARPPKVKTDERGRSVWAETVETATLELVSTQMLRKIIDSDDQERQSRMRDAAAHKEGLLAHDTQNDRFEVISDEELKQILEENPGLSESEKMFERAEDSATVLVQDNEELELVSTQFLRKILDPTDTSSESDDESAGGGFNPYDSA